MATIDLSTDLQSSLHDMADELGERVARGELVEVEGKKAVTAAAKCTCSRYSERREDGFLYFWYSADPKCQYVHLQKLPMAHKIKL